MVEQILPLALALPLLGATTIGLGGLWLPILRKQKYLIGGIASMLVFGAFFLFLAAFLSYKEPSYFAFAWDWIALDPLRIPLRYQVDTLSLWMSLIITGIGALIHLYSIGYMAEEEGSWRYFAFLNLFIFAMLTLVLADSLPLLFLGWEGVGACSYFLIGYWFGEEANARAAQKAFIMNRIGDVGLLAGMIWLYAETGTFDIERLKDYMYGGEVAMGVGLLFFLAATGKSAQLPLYTWLPDAMAGPTPVSALIHAATMVTAGVYLMARMDFLYNLTPETLSIVGAIAITTALLGGLVALAQQDIKKVLAYSTVSQLGFMFAAVSAGAYTAAIFHVFTHAFFKALLFLGSGSLIHATGTQDIRKMGGLRKKMPITGWTFWIGTVAIAGIPPLAGFFSKDEISAAVYTRGTTGEATFYVYWLTLVGVAFLTALYMGRLAWVALEGEYRGEGTPHESPPEMTIPLGVLAVGSIAAGWIGLPPLLGESWIREHWLSQSIKELSVPSLSHGTELFLLCISTIVGLVGLGVAWLLYGRKKAAGDTFFSKHLGRFYTLLSQQLQVDMLYERAFVQPYYILADLAKDVIGPWIGRGIPALVAQMLSRLGEILSRLQVGYTPLYLSYMIAGGLLLLLWVLTG
ncbi:MAG: NADH-quinone oxidoreductase subunit L [Bacteroidia bacterium]|nr:NADH-quinone oxidoreductase subunit L [Bacteroidia bacterium]